MTEQTRFMFIDKDGRTAILKVFVASDDDEAVRFVDRIGEGTKPSRSSLFNRITEAIRGPRGRSRNPGDVVMLPLSLGAVRGYATELHLFALNPPSVVGGRLLVLKGSDGVIISSRAGAPDRLGQVQREVQQHLEALGFEWANFPRAVVLLGQPDGDARSASERLGAPVFFIDESGPGFMDSVKAVTADILKAGAKHLE